MIRGCSSERTITGTTSWGEAGATFKPNTDHVQRFFLFLPEMFVSTFRVFFQAGQSLEQSVKLVYWPYFQRLPMAAYSANMLKAAKRQGCMFSRVDAPSSINYDHMSQRAGHFPSQQRSICTGLGWDPCKLHVSTFSEPTCPFKVAFC